MNFIARLIAVLLAIIATSAHAGGPLSVCDAAPNAPIKYPGTGTVNLNYDLGNLGSRAKAQADAMVTSAVSVWTNVGTASITIGRGADLPVDVTTANYLTYFNNTSDGLNPVIYDTDGSLIDQILGVGAKNFTLGIAGSTYFLAPTCTYIEGRAVINGFNSVSDATLGVTIAHEIGHLIGMDHSQLDTAQGLTSGTRPIMYPIASRDTVTLHEDDQAAVSALYPDATLNSVYGQISGTFVLADGATPVRGANLWATETTTNKVYSIVSDYLTQNTGFFKLLLPAGAYNLRAEAIQSSFTGGSSVGPYSETSSDPSFQPPLYVGSVPMSTVTLGNATPTTFFINAGCAATLTFRINGVGSVGGNCSVPGSLVLTVNKTGTGTGTVTSAPAGINCGSTCSNSFATNSMVTLTATPDAGINFLGWSGAGCSGTGTCTVTMSIAQTVTANFDLPEAFPANCAFPVGWTTPGSAYTSWAVAADRKRTGACSMKSNPMPEAQFSGEPNANKAQIQVGGTFSAGTISFYYNVSSEQGYDCLRFIVDGMQRAEMGQCNGPLGNGGLGASGDISTWTFVSIPIAAGTHTFLWSYEKDEINAVGADAAWIDDVLLPPLAATGTLQFTTPTISVSEGIGNAVVNVSRTGGSTGAASVTFATSNGSATAGPDYTGQAGTLNWTDGDSANKTITIPIIDDASIESNETITVTLSSPVGATLGTPASITVTILDNDAPTVPGAPTIGTAIPGNTQALINFTPPASNGGANITSYTVTCTGGSGGTASGAAPPLTVNGLTNGVLYTCSVTATNSVGPGPASGTVTVTPSAAAPLVLLSVQSRKLHGGLGPFFVPITLGVLIGGTVSVEPRASGGSHNVVFMFNGTVSSLGTASVTPVGSAVSSFSGSEVTVTLTGVPDNNRVTVSLTGINGSTSANVSLGFLVGDVTGNRSVNAADVAAVKANQNATVNQSTAKFDLNASGVINAQDVTAVKARAAIVLP